MPRVHSQEFHRLTNAHVKGMMHALHRGRMARRRDVEANSRAARASIHLLTVQRLVHADGPIGPLRDCSLQFEACGASSQHANARVGSSARLHQSRRTAESMRRYTPQ